jgi:pimeloyl-ACP methyl ester carboxylesterase
LANTTCPFDPVPGLRVECYNLPVPEDRAGNLADTIRLSVVLVHGQGASLSPYPLVFLQGGPGASAILYVAAMSAAGSDWIYPLLAGRDLIVFDQRGVGYSQPSLQCPELLAAYSRDVTEEWSLPQRQDGYMAALRACRDRLTSMGANPSAYTTSASAADVVAILDALGYEQADLYGVSYGTRLALAVMRDYPQRVHSAILDSSVPLQTSMYLQAEALEDSALQALFQGCAADAACQAAYPDLEQAYQEVVAQFNAAPVSLRFYNVLVDGQLHEAAVDGAWLRSAVVWGMRAPDSLAIVPQVIYDAQAGDYSPLAYFLYLQNYGYSGLSLGMSIAVECGEEILPHSADELAAAVGWRSADNIVLSGLDDATLLIAACQEWGMAAVDPREREPLVSAIPTLVLAGQYDPVTPPALGEEVVRTLSRGYLFAVPGGGHVPSMAPPGDCPREIIRSFLADPTRRPDGSCLAALDTAPFVIPPPAADVKLEPFVDDIMGVAGVRPAGWAPDAQGQGYLDRLSWLLDPTRVAVQGAVAPADYWLQYLTTGFVGIGFDEEPQPAGQRQANGLTWHLYTARTFRHPVDMALAQGNKRTILVLLVSEPREHDTMYELVFIPMVDAATER